MEIQKRLQVDQQKYRFNLNKAFARLMLSGNVSQAAILINRRKGCVLEMDKKMKEQLIKKHPKASAAKHGTLLFGPEEKVEDVIFEFIDANLVCEVVKKIKGSGGPTLIDTFSKHNKMLYAKLWPDYQSSYVRQSLILII